MCHHTSTLHPCGCIYLKALAPCAKHIECTLRCGRWMDSTICRRRTDEVLRDWVPYGPCLRRKWVEEWEVEKERAGKAKEGEEEGGEDRVKGEGERRKWGEEEVSE